MKRAELKKIKEKLEKEKLEIEKQLSTFAKKDKALPGDWDTKFPYFNGEAGGAILEKAADEVEEYATLLPIEYSLEERLQNIEQALEKIKKGTYGICEKCKKPIDKKRLKICPEAKFCKKCLK